MNLSRREQVTVRVSETAAWAALAALITKIYEAHLNVVAGSLASGVGATFDGYEVEFDPENARIGNRIDFFFGATPAQRREIGRALRAKGFDVVEAAPRWGRV